MPRADAASLFPIFLKLEGRPCLVVGAGAVAESKIASLVAAGATVHVVAPRASAVVHGLASAGRITWEARAFKPRDLDGTLLVVVATADRSLNERVFQEARRRGVLANVVDDPPRCDFYYPSVVRRGDLEIAISTNGHSPALAQRLKRELEQQFTTEYADWIEDLGRKRRKLFRKTMDHERRRRLLHRLAAPEQFEAFRRGARGKAGGNRAW
ncbi:MAG TPA: bifunctional precorrin-2 dehydrogenase/sirohydrochlorin ferrochelatase [Terriglobia bacterium]|nr:bifunctional precorrin-2 dehydrogenase/sirohydrochlorin ferrochelatase [Terriglobia bacterium]